MQLVIQIITISVISVKKEMREHNLFFISIIFKPTSYIFLRKMKTNHLFTKYNVYFLKHRD